MKKLIAVLIAMIAISGAAFAATIKVDMKPVLSNTYPYVQNAGILDITKVNITAEEMPGMDLYQWTYKVTPRNVHYFTNPLTGMVTGVPNTVAEFTIDFGCNVLNVIEDGSLTATAGGQTYTALTQEQTLILSFDTPLKETTPLVITFLSKFGLDDAQTAYATAQTAKYYNEEGCSILLESDAGFIAPYSPDTPEVPEPATLIALATGCVGLAGFKFAKK